MRVAFVLFALIATIHADVSSPREQEQDTYEINRLYYCKGPNLNIGSKCEGNVDCRTGFCAGQDISDCRGTCRNKRADGQLAYKVGAQAQYESCVAGHGICGTCGEQVALEKPCTKAHQCRAEWCEGIRTDGCHGTCKAKRPDGSAAFEVCRFRGEPCTPDYDSCLSGEGICGRCAKPNFIGQQCSVNEDCEEGAYCAPQSEGGIENCGGKCVRMREDGEEAYMAPFHGVEEWGNSDYKSCKNYKDGDKEPGHCGYCAAELLGLGQKCAFDADCEEDNWCAGGGSDKLAALTLDRAACAGTCASCPVECGDYGCNIREGDAAILQCGMRTVQNTYNMPQTKVGVPILAICQCFGVRTKKLVRLIEDDLTEEEYPYSMHISWTPKERQKPLSKLPPTAAQSAEAEAVDDGIVSSPKFDNCATIRKIRVQTLSNTGTTDQGMAVISHIILTPKSGCVGMKYSMDGKFTVKLSYFHIKVKSAFEFKSPEQEMTDGEYELDVPNELMKTLYYGAFMHGKMPMFVRIIAKPRMTLQIRGKVKPNRTFKMKWENALVGNAAFSYNEEGASYTNEMKLNRPGGGMVGARDQNPYEFFEVIDGDSDATMWVRIGYEFSIEVNGLGFSMFPSIGGALRLQKDVAPGCNKMAPKQVFNNIFEAKQVAIKTQILGLEHRPKCGVKQEDPTEFDTTESMIKMCKDIGNFRHSNELVCHDEIINWALSVTSKKKLSEHLDETCKALVERMKEKHKLVTSFKYAAFDDAKFSNPYWTYMVTFGDVGTDVVSLDCDPDAVFRSSGSINDVCIDLQDLRPITPCERDPQSATCHVSKVTGLDGQVTGATASPPKDPTEEPASTGAPDAPKVTDTTAAAGEEADTTAEAGEEENEQDEQKEETEPTEAAKEGEGPTVIETEPPQEGEEKADEGGEKADEGGEATDDPPAPEKLPDKSKSKAKSSNVNSQLENEVAKAKEDLDSFFNEKEVALEIQEDYSNNVALTILGALGVAGGLTAGAWWYSRKPKTLTYSLLEEEL